MLRIELSMISALWGFNLLMLGSIGFERLDITLVGLLIIIISIIYGIYYYKKLPENKQGIKQNG